MPSEPPPRLEPEERELWRFWCNPVQNMVDSEFATLLRSLSATREEIAAKDAKLRAVLSWLRCNANAEKEPKARASLIEAHNAVLKIIEGRGPIPLPQEPSE